MPGELAFPDKEWEHIMITLLCCPGMLGGSTLSDSIWGRIMIITTHTEAKGQATSPAHAPAPDTISTTTMVTFITISTSSTPTRCYRICAAAARRGRLPRGSTADWHGRTAPRAPRLPALDTISTTTMVTFITISTSSTPTRCYRICAAAARHGRLPRGSTAEPAPWLRGLHTLVYVVALVWHCRCVHDGLAGMSPDGERIIIVQTKVARPNCPAGIETGATSVHHSYCQPDYNTTMTTTAATTSLDVT